MNAPMRRARSATKLRQQAEKLLCDCNVIRPPVHVEKVAAHLGATVKYSPFEGELAGVLARDDARVVIGVNSSHHPNRQRFTIAHECGHLLLHEGEAYVDTGFRVNWRDDVSSKAVDHREIEANRFAAELLMPHRMLIADLREHGIDLENEDAIKSLAKRYGVSEQAMTHRISNLMEELLNSRR